MSPLRRRIMVCCWLCCCWALEALAIICIFLRIELSLTLIMPITGDLLANLQLHNSWGTFAPFWIDCWSSLFMSVEASSRTATAFSSLLDTPDSLRLGM